MQVTRRSARVAQAAWAACSLMPVKRERYQPSAFWTVRSAAENWLRKRRLTSVSQSLATVSSRKAPTWTAQRPAASRVHAKRESRIAFFGSH